MYYLNSRYYIPEWGRFLNSDNYGGQVGEILTHNTYAYCGNNPINRIDSSGLFWQELLETFTQTMQRLTPVFAGSVGIAGSDGPLPFGDIIAGVLMAGTSVGALGYSAYKVATMPKVTSKDKSEAIPKIPPYRQAIYYMAQATYPGAEVYLNQPLSFENAKLRLNMGGDIWTKNAFDAKQLCIAVGGGFTGPTNDNKPLNAMHYHPTNYIDRGHVFFGPDKNLKFIYWR